MKQYFPPNIKRLSFGDLTQAQKDWAETERLERERLVERTLAMEEVNCEDCVKAEVNGRIGVVKPCLMHFVKAGYRAEDYESRFGEKAKTETIPAPADEEKPRIVCQTCELKFALPNTGHGPGNKCAGPYQHIEDFEAERNPVTDENKEDLAVLKRP